MRRSRRSSRLLGALLLLALLAALLPLSTYLAGILPGGGRAPDPERPALRARPMSALQVTVVRADDAEPIEGARIVVRGLAGGEADLTSDRDGKASLEGVGQGPVQVRAIAADGEAVAWADPRVEPDLLLSVAARGERTGQVRSAEGAPLRGRVQLVGRLGEVLAETETDERGRYTLPAHAEAEGVVAVPADGAPAVAAAGDVVAGAGERLEGRLLGAEGGVLEVHALAPAGSGDTVLTLRMEWPVGADGAFAGALPVGARAWAVYDGLPVRLASGDLSLPERAKASGQVRLAEPDDPVGGALLLFRPLLDGGFAAPLPALRVEADATGRFEAAGFGAVPYSVEIRAPGCATRIVPEVALDAPLDLRVRRGYDIVGFVVDAAGLPVAHAELKAMSLPDPESEFPLATVVADAEGRFHLAGLGGDHARIRVEAAGHHPTTLTQVRPNGDLRIVLQRK